MSLEFNEFKKKFPNLANELEQNKMRVKIDAIRSEAKNKKQLDTLRGFEPDVVDFLRRCGDIEEAEEIIDFLENRGEISHEYAVTLHVQLHDGGLRSFGSKKEIGYYLKHERI